MTLDKEVKDDILSRANFAEIGVGKCGRYTLIPNNVLNLLIRSYTSVFL